MLERGEVGGCEAGKLARREFATSAKRGRLVIYWRLGGVTSKSSRPRTPLYFFSGTHFPSPLALLHIRLATWTPRGRRPERKSCSILVSTRPAV